jgi:hypothetical protein
MRMATDTAIRDHQAWLGYLQPDGLVVSPAALVDAQVLLDRNAAPLQQRFLGFVDRGTDRAPKDPELFNLPELLTDFLEWPADCIFGVTDERPIPEDLKISLKNFGETLEPDFAFRDPKPANEDNPWTLLIQSLPTGTALDTPIESAQSGWSASPSRRFERLLREAEVPIGLLSNGKQLRLLYAPRGENVGTLTFPVAAMSEIAGRPILAAFETLLGYYRLLSAPSSARLPALLTKSRQYQSRVSTQLSQQVLAALYELLRGFQAADEREHSELLKQVLADHPDQIYGGLLTVLMRLVFLLYAEDRGLMPDTSLYAGNYSVHGLFEKLRDDCEHYPDTIDHRYGAWAQLTALFRTVYHGCEHQHLKMPTRHGHLFDPDRYTFLEGRTSPEQRLPLVSDGVLYRVLHNLLVLSGERLSYRTLDVEQIGSVYETMMGFRLEITSGTAIALKPAKAHGAPVPVNLDELLATEPGKRKKLIQDQTDYKLTAVMNKGVKAAESIDDLLAGLEKRIARNATPHPVPVDTMVLMPTDERRKTGSHYTPRKLTEPIVAKALEPILAQLGDMPTPEDILALKVCDPAMGSGAFLVEACRQLGDQLVTAWAAHGYKPVIPPDEDEILHARRLVAQRCLYGVDRNPMAVDLAKLSLWLATLAKDHPFTFLDHSLRAGDSLVGLTRDQIAGFHWAPTGMLTDIRRVLNERIETVTKARRQILSAGDDMPPAAKAQKLVYADEQLSLIRLAGNALVAAFFTAGKAKQRESRRLQLANQLELYLKNEDMNARQEIGQAVQEFCSGHRAATPFHWDIEFPEVFDTEQSGFDTFVGNPPFMGGTRIVLAETEAYRDWLQVQHTDSHGNGDLVAHFFRRAFTLLRRDGTFGLIATNTIGQGDTRTTGLTWICNHGGTIYHARRRYKWPGQAAVIVSIVHVTKGDLVSPFDLDGHEQSLITAYLLHAGSHDNPEPLMANAGLVFKGSDIYGMGFTFDNNRNDDAATSLEEMQRIIDFNPASHKHIYPLIGGEELNGNPRQGNHRFIINFGKMTEEEARQWPDLMQIVESKVRPQREALGNSASAQSRKRYWWQFSRPTIDLYDAIRPLPKALANSQVSPHLAYAFLPSQWVYANTLIVYALPTYSAFATMQSRIHETWARVFSSSFKDDLRYTPSDCFETFPFPDGFQTNPLQEEVGATYYEFRAKLMIRNNGGLTTTYNCFHDPASGDADILKLRQLHDAMDRAVLNAYDWGSINVICGFGLDYLDFEDEDLPEDIPEQLWWPTAAEALDFAAKLPQTRRRLPWRYRWPEETRDEILARLLKLNAERAEEERRTGVAAAVAEQQKKKKKKKAKKTKRGRKKKQPDAPTLIDLGEGDDDG